MDFTRRCAYISNSYYNKGLHLATERNLTGAAECLKNSLKFNKHNTPARNLLGLIYFEIGETADALVQWVLSLNLQPTNNDADRYLDEVQRTAGFIDSCEKAIERFNQTLALAQGGSDDLAIVQLSKIAAHYKNYVRVHVLLGLLYMANDQYAKAFKSFQNALRIDRGNTIAIRCTDYLRTLQKDQKINRKSFIKQANNTDSDTDNDDKKQDSKSKAYISIEPYKENNGWQTLINIGLGLIIGAATILLVYMPAKEASIAHEYNEQVVSVSAQLNEANGKIKRLESEQSDLLEQYNELDQAKSTIDEGYRNKLLSYQNLAGAIKEYGDNDLMNSAKFYVAIDPDHMTSDEGDEFSYATKYYEELQSYYESEGYVQLTALGDKAFELGDFDTAMEYYDLSIMVYPSNPVALYKKGLCLERKDDRTGAVELFTDVINNYPDSSVADLAKLERGY